MKFNPLRSIIHISGIITILIREYYGLSFTLIIISFISLLYLLSESLRLRGKSIPLTRLTVLAARDSEADAFIIKPIYYSIAIILSLLFFPKSIGNSAIVILTIGDGVAGITGIWWGRRQLPYTDRKTAEGSLIGFSTAFLIILLFVPIESALLGTIVGAFIEGYGRRIDDNISVPLSSGFAMWISSLIN